MVSFVVKREAKYPELLDMSTGRHDHPMAIVAEEHGIEERDDRWEFGELIKRWESFGRGLSNKTVVFSGVGFAH